MNTLLGQPEKHFVVYWITGNKRHSSLWLLHRGPFVIIIGLWTKNSRVMTFPLPIKVTISAYTFPPKVACLCWQQVKTYWCLMSLLTADSSLLTSFGVILSALRTCCVRSRYFSTATSSWLDLAKENHGGQYTETQVEGTKSLARLFPLLTFQILYRTCVMQVGVWVVKQKSWNSLWHVVLV